LSISDAEGGAGDVADAVVLKCDSQLISRRNLGAGQRSKIVGLVNQVDLKRLPVVDLASDLTSVQTNNILLPCACLVLRRVTVQLKGKARERARPAAAESSTGRARTRPFLVSDVEQFWLIPLHETGQLKAVPHPRKAARGTIGICACKFLTPKHRCELQRWILLLNSECQRDSLGERPCCSAYGCVVSTSRRDGTSRTTSGRSRLGATTTTTGGQTQHAARNHHNGSGHSQGV
jgi:hypothetical protein